MAKVTHHYFFLNRVAQMQRVAMRDAIAGLDARRLVQRKQQIVGHVRPKFSHDDRAICERCVWGSGSLTSLRSFAPIVLAVTLVIGSGASALAFDCLTSKPAGARGYWHSQSVAGKTCWFGADWRSFLAKSKAQPSAAQAEPAPVAKSEPKSEPDAELKSEPQPTADVTPPATASTAAEQPQDPPGLRQATPAEAAALINSISLDFEPAAGAPPQPAKIAPKAAPEAHAAQSHNTGDWLITFGELAIIGGVLATLFRQFRRRRAMKAQRAQPQFVPVSLRFAPPLQPDFGADDQSSRQAPWVTALNSARRETVPST